jgi:two-component system, NarL family, response regulator LiaR
MRENGKARVLIVDDQEFMRAGLRTVLARRGEVEVVGEAGDGEEGVRLCRELAPDLVLMDIEMPGLDGIGATRRIKAEMPSTIILVLTAHTGSEFLLEAVAAGAAGYLLKENAMLGVEDAVAAVLAGESILDSGLSMQLLRRMSEDRSSPPEAEALTSLTDRELEILGLISRGQTNADIASSLYLSVGTVKTHVHRIISKLGVSDRTQAAVLAIKAGVTSE